jgi:hypothetical protein
LGFLVAAQFRPPLFCLETIMQTAFKTGDIVKYTAYDGAYFGEVYPDLPGCDHTAPHDHVFVRDYSCESNGAHLEDNEGHQYKGWHARVILDRHDGRECARGVVCSIRDNEVHCCNADRKWYDFLYSTWELVERPVHGVTDPGHAHALKDPGHNHGIDANRAMIERDGPQAKPRDEKLVNELVDALLDKQIGVKSAPGLTTTASFSHHMGLPFAMWGQGE